MSRQVSTTRARQSLPTSLPAFPAMICRWSSIRATPGRAVGSCPVVQITDELPLAGDLVILGSQLRVLRRQLRLSFLESQLERLNIVGSG